MIPTIRAQKEKKQSDMEWKRKWKEEEKETKKAIRALKSIAKKNAGTITELTKLLNSCGYNKNTEFVRGEILRITEDTKYGREKLYTYKTRLGWHKHCFGKETLYYYKTPGLITFLKYRRKIFWERNSGPDNEVCAW